MQCARGFTYIELLIVLIVLGIVSVAVMPRTPSLGVEAGPEVEQLAADLRYTQMRAMNDGVRYCMSFVGNTYTLSTVVSGCTAPLVSAGGLQSPVTLRDAQLSATGLPANVLVFDGMGTPYGSAASSASPLTAPVVLTVTVAGVSRTVSVTPVTGLITANP